MEPTSTWVSDFWPQLPENWEIVAHAVSQPHRCWLVVVKRSPRKLIRGICRASAIAAWHFRLFVEADILSFVGYAGFLLVQFKW